MSFLVLVRHGQSTWNLEKRFTGWVDVDLTDQGKIEAEKEDEFRNFEINVEKDIYEGISINNCGLIIIWPFISKLIEKLEQNS